MEKVFFILFAMILAGPITGSAQEAAVRAGSQCTFAGKSGGDLSKAELSSSTRIEFLSSDSTWIVSQFRLSVYSKASSKEFNVKGNVLTEEMLDALRSMPVGSKVYFEYIRVSRVSSMDVTRQVAPLAFRLIE